MEKTPSLRLVAIYACLGMVGFVAAFGSLGTLREYFLNPSLSPELSEQVAGTWRGLAGTLFRPFLSFALVLLWCRAVDRSARGREPGRLALPTFAVGCGIIVANLTFGFNRASFVFPLLSLTAAFTYRVCRISLGVLCALGLAATVPLAAIGTYRASSGTADDALKEPGKIFGSDLSEGLQVYACAPQFLGYFLERTGWDKSVYWGHTLIASALHPVPVIGKSFRDSSGVAIYNRMIYGNAGFEDQIIPFQGELILNFHLPGLVAGFFALGLLIGEFQQRLQAAGSAFAIYSIHYVSLWTSTLIIWSVAILSQVLVYFCWPIYLYIGYAWLQRWAARQGRRT